jgi:two-component system chemotaxis sensor kinase CheA
MAASRNLIFEFVSEAKEHLANVGDDLLGLEQRQDDATRYRIDRLFRAVHSVKGGAGFFGCRSIEELAHAMESVLEDARARETAPPAPVIDALLAGADRIQALLDDVERSNDADVSDLVIRLRGAAPPDGGRVAPAAALLPAVRPADSPAGWEMAEPAFAERPAGDAYLYGLKIDLAACFHQQGRGPAVVLRRIEQAGTLLNAALDVPAGNLEDGLPTGPLVYRALVSSPAPPHEFARALGLAAAEITVLEPAAAPARDAPAPAASPVPVAEPAAPAEGPRPRAETSNTLRIPVGLVDRLMTLAGELVLVRNQAVRAIDPRNTALRPLVQRLDAVTSELQDAVLRTRMQPVGNLFGKFPRMVRDLAKQLGKEIDLEISGTEVELDKTILESLSDPLTHLIRNCCDHGIEPPADRARAGKPGQGQITLRARHLGGQIFLEVRDDGRGLDPDAIHRKALERALRTPAELARLGEKDLFSLILMPGFSTAAAVTDLSGRGVGMDVVKTNLDRLGGVLEIDSTPGRGTAFTLRLPLTLAIIPCLLVTAGGARYAVPQKDLEELVCLHPGRGRPRIEYAFDQEVMRLRDRLLPLVRLTEVFERPRPFTAATREEIVAKYRGGGAAGNGAAPVFLAVVKVGAQRFGLVVEEVLRTEEIVVKPMHQAMKPLACFAGATILGDGRVALILSVEGIARHAGVAFEIGAEHAQPDRGETVGVETQSVLLFQYGPQEQFALPLPLIRRIVLVQMDRVERVGDREFLTVDGVPTRVLRLDRFLSVSAAADRPTMFLLLPRTGRRPFGVLLSAVLDTVTQPLELAPDAGRGEGLLGSALVHDRLTLFLDIYRLADRLDPPEPRDALPAPAGPARVLVVEDTQFFREVVKGYLEAAGYEVTTAEHGGDALARLDEQAFDLVVSDIEMPVMDGWAFARAVRQRPGGAALPLLALTTLARDEDRGRSAAAGFDRHEVKLERERFLVAVAALLRGRRGGK